MAELPIPVYKTLEQIYPDSAPALIEGQRWNTLLEGFERVFGSKATHVARAPGRVNLIGEHIDYALFGVLPTAVERDILIALGPSSEPGGLITAENVEDHYEKQTFTASRETGTWVVGIDKTKLRWESYVKAGYYGVLNQFFSEDGAQPKSINMLVTGSVPAGSGLSSSAAMVVASTLSFLVMNDKLDKVNKGELVNLSMENEKRVGVNSGGMDQAASVISTPSSALYITFYPSLSSSAVQLPRTNPPSVFVISNSLVVSDKAVSAKTNYNLRVVETLVAARVLALGLGVKVGPQEKVTLREVVGRWAGEEEGTAMEPEKLAEVLEKVNVKVEEILGKGNRKDGLTYDEMVAASGLEEPAFKELYLSWVEVHATHFRLYSRAKHVITEALRVLQFREVCSTHTSSSDEDTLQHLGSLMNASMDSCSRLFDCSCKELDEMTALARQAGAYGSRLTGAGWGGCAVSLVAEPDVPKFLKAMSEGYSKYKGLSKEQLDEAMFATKPGSGAGVYVVE